MLGLVCEAHLLKMKGWTRAVLLFSLVCTLSLLFTDLELEPWESELGNRNNIINIYMVKWGWAWTFFPVGVFLLTCGYMQQGQLISAHMVKNVSPIFIGTIVWYVFVEVVFPYIEDQTGVCRVTEYTNKRSCMKAGFWWNGFDSSGHCFLLLWNILFIVEESSQYNTLNQYRLLLDNKDRTDSSSALKGDINKILERVRKMFPLLQIQLIILSILTFIWEFMLLSTAVHFHSTAEKVVGSLCALFSWFLIYRVFRRKSDKLVLSVSEKSR